MSDFAKLDMAVSCKHPPKVNRPFPRVKSLQRFARKMPTETIPNATPHIRGELEDRQGMTSHIVKAMLIMIGFYSVMALAGWLRRR